LLLFFFAETSFCNLSRGYQVEGKIYFEKPPENDRFYVSQYIATRREEIFLKSVRFHPLPRLPGRREKYFSKNLSKRGFLALSNT